MRANNKLTYKLLLLLEIRLKETDNWQIPHPEADAFTSQEPFCVDTMSCQQWLKHVFIPRMQALLDAEAPLPQACALTPQVEIQLPSQDQALITEVTQALDDWLTEGRVPPAQLLRQV
ncbi:YqcC family protein [Marinospirillum sp.]|uniref:YqcC family protein n=1 Tax=Marinospirillum sp. TaxID=2183934 RepID=UPI00385132EB